MSACARFAVMIGARPGELLASEERALAEHLAGCEACQARLADAAALEGLLGEGLAREAARRDFATFADEVLARVERQEGRWRRLLGWGRRHRALAAITALAPSLAALALIVYLGRGGLPAPEAGDVELEAEGWGATVLRTSDGPVVLLDDSAHGS
jgi:anti-sigma factor RsiW